MNDRIKLAEAMGWKHEQMRENLRRACWHLPPAEDWRYSAALPDPYTDANDDYAVLEWMRKENNKPWQFELSQLDGRKRYKWDYQIGDYARAALKVLTDNTPDPQTAAESPLQD